jgi:hypothetical protein
VCLSCFVHFSVWSIQFLEQHNTLELVVIYELYQDLLVTCIRKLLCIDDHNKKSQQDNITSGCGAHFRPMEKHGGPLRRTRTGMKDNYFHI